MLATAKGPRPNHGNGNPERTEHSRLVYAKAHTGYTHTHWVLAGLAGHQIKKSLQTLPQTIHELGIASSQYGLYGQPTAGPKRMSCLMTNLCQP